VENNNNSVDSEVNDINNENEFSKSEEQFKVEDVNQDYKTTEGSYSYTPNLSDTDDSSNKVYNTTASEIPYNYGAQPKRKGFSIGKIILTFFILAIALAVSLFFIFSKTDVGTKVLSVITDETFSPDKYVAGDFEEDSFSKFTEKRIVVVDHLEGYDEESDTYNDRYLYDESVVDIELLNDYITFLIDKGYQAYSMDDGSVALFKFVDDMVLEMYFYQDIEEKTMEISFYTYKYNAENFSWIEEVE